MYDAIVIGAHCAGSPTAMFLARKGYRVLLVDKATFLSDTMSTHLIRIPGIARLKRWGVLDKIIASKSPPISSMSLDLGPFALVGMPPSFAPRPPHMQQLLAALQGNQEQTDRFLGLAEGTTSFSEFFSPENVQQIMAAAGVGAAPTRPVEQGSHTSPA